MSQEIGNESTKFIINKEVINIDLDRMRMEGQYESANQQRRLMARTEGYAKTQSEKKVAGNSFCTTTFTYQIRHLDPLTQTLFYPIKANTIFPILYTENVANYRVLSITFYNGF
jgi:hypothetical protein